MEDDARRRRGGPPGGGGGGGGPPGGGGNGVPDFDDGRLSIQATRYQPGDSDASCADRRRGKGEIVIVLPPSPKSAGELGNYQFAVENIIALASGRYQRRVEWIRAITRARKPEDLEFVPKKCRSLDYKLAVAALASCEKNPALYGLLRREGRASGNKNIMRNGRQCLRRIYTYFALPSMATEGLKVTYAVIDLTAIKLIDADAGLEHFWNRWRDCIIRIADLPKRPVYQHMFADEMRKSKKMALYVRHFDEMEHDDARETWEWLETRGGACFERQHQRDNHTQTLGVLSGKASTHAEFEMAVPGVEGGAKGGEGVGQWAQGEEQSPNNFVDPGQWPTSPAPPRRPLRSQVPRTAEQRAARGPCWFYATGACVVAICSEEHRIITAQERVNIPTAWVNWNLPENQKGGASGREDRSWNNSQSDNDSDGRGKGPRPGIKGDRPPKGGRNPKGEGKRAGGKESQKCRFISEGKVCPHGEKCYSYWSHPSPGWTYKRACRHPYPAHPLHLAHPCPAFPLRLEVPIPLQM
jgi:hypothetical protein